MEHISPLFDTIKNIRIINSKVQLSKQDSKIYENSVNKLKSVYSEFIRIHRSATQVQNSKNYMLLNSGSEQNQSKGNVKGQNSQKNQNIQNNPNMYVNTTTSSTDDILKCYSEVPDLFFKTDFSLRNAEIFDLVLGRMLMASNSDSTSNSTSNSKDSNTTVEGNEDDEGKGNKTVNAINSDSDETWKGTTTEGT